MRLSAWLTHWDAPHPRPERRALFEGAADEVRDSVLVTEISLEGARLLTPAPLEIGGKVFKGNAVYHVAPHVGSAAPSPG